MIRVFFVLSKREHFYFGKEYMAKLTHIDEQGNAIMVDVSNKKSNARTAKATGRILVSKEIIDTIQSHTNKKGDVLTVAQIAGIMASKKTSELIPLCHPLMLSKSEVTFKVEEATQEIVATSFVSLSGQTGVEMEALTAVSVALLTIYDMCKAMDKSMVIKDIRLLEKTGGKSGDFKVEV